MNKNLISLILVISFLVGCLNNSNKEYDLPIDKDKLINIMVDLTIAEAATKTYQVKYRDSIKNLYRFQIEQIYQTNIGLVDSTLSLLYKNPELNKELQKIVLDSIKALEKGTKRDR